MPYRPATYKLIREQSIPRPRAEVFEFFDQPANLAFLTPPWLAFHMITPMPATMAEGLRLEYRIKILGLPIAWTSEVTHYDPPHGFIDEQVEGPYRVWRHRHIFTDEGSSTRVRDEVDYDLKFGPLGVLAHALYVRRALELVFDFRATVLRKMFG